MPGLADCRTIIQLYLSIVRPHLEYASSLWDPHMSKDITALESVQRDVGNLCNTLSGRAQN